LKDIHIQERALHTGYWTSWITNK